MGLLFVSVSVSTSIDVNADVDVPASFSFSGIPWSKRSLNSGVIFPSLSTIFKVPSSAAIDIGMGSSSPGWAVGGGGAIV